MLSWRIPFLVSINSNGARRYIRASLSRGGHQAVSFETQLGRPGWRRSQNNEFSIVANVRRTDARAYIIGQCLLQLVHQLTHVFRVAYDVTQTPGIIGI
jgi:hypothetical protein